MAWRRSRVRSSYAPPSDNPDELVVYMDKYTVGIRVSAKWYWDTHDIRGSARFRSMNELDPSLGE